jgi:hypothetical protein
VEEAAPIESFKAHVLMCNPIPASGGCFTPIQPQITNQRQLANGLTVEKPAPSTNGIAIGRYAERAPHTPLLLSNY